MKLPKELEARTIVHHNDLLASSYSLKLNAMRLVFFAATKYNSKQAATSVEITFTEYAEAFNIKSNAVYEELVHAVEELQKSVIKLDDDKNIEAFPWVFKSRYPKSNKGKSVELIFHPDLKPLMFELSERFTPITLENMAQLDTPFSIRLYQWLKQAQ
ncbi:replication initiation protein [Enterovibrio norvegicus]|uniref:replication initiation protein n=3 Tax=Vibrionaceae TaxID=641 RepID=UPI0039AF8F28